MKSLYDILSESILDSDTDIVSKERINELELHLRYDLFIKYVGDLLWNKSPYAYFPGSGTIEFELSKELQDSSNYYFYNECEKALINYFKYLQKMYKRKYIISWSERSIQAGIIHYLNFKEDNKNNVIEFRVRNLYDNRRIDIVWPKSFVFMKPSVNESILDNDDTVLSDIGKNKSYYIALFAKYLIETYKDKLDFKNIRSDSKNYDYVYIPLNKKVSQDLTDYILNNKNRTVTDLFKNYTSKFNDRLITKLKIEKLIENKNIELCVLASDYAFNTFKFGDLDRQDPVYIYPAVGIVMNTHDITDPVKVYCIDLGDSKTHKEFIEDIKQLLK